MTPLDKRSSNTSKPELSSPESPTSVGVLQKIKDRLWFARNVGIPLFLMERADARARKKYCHRGYHKLRSGMTSWTFDGKTRTVRYLRCAHCNFMFFAKRSDKKLFEDLTAKDDSAVKKWLSSALSRHYEASVVTNSPKSRPVEKEKKRK